MHPKNQEFARGRKEIADAVHNAVRIETFGEGRPSEQAHLQSNYFLRLHMRLDQMASLAQVSPLQKAQIRQGESKRNHSFGLLSDFTQATGAMVADGVIALGIKETGSAIEAGKAYEINRLSAMLDRIAEGTTGYDIPHGRDKDMFKFMFDLQLEGQGVDMKNLQAVHADILAQTELSIGQIQAVAWMRDIIGGLKDNLVIKPIVQDEKASLTKTHAQSAMLFPVEVVMAPKKTRVRAPKPKDNG